MIVSPTRIAFVSMMSGAAWGGSELLWAAAADKALQRGHAVAVSVYRWRPRAAAIDALERAGATILERPLLKVGRLGRRAYSLLRPLAAVARWNPHVICASGGGPWDGLTSPESAQFRLLLNGRFPYVLVSHGNNEADIPGHQTRMAAVDLFTNAASAVFISPRMIQIAQRQLAHDIPRAVVLSNPLNLQVPDALPWPDVSEQGPWRIAVVARLDSNKGVDILLEALSAQPWPSRPWILSVFGDGPLRTHFQNLAEYYGLSRKVQFRGHSADIAAIWKDHHLLALTSRSEGVPLAMVEAMICGRPAAMTDVGGIALWVRDGVDGFLASGATTAAVAQMLQRAWDARDRWPEIGRAARASALGRLDPDPGSTLLDLILKAVPDGRAEARC